MPEQVDIVAYKDFPDDWNSLEPPVKKAIHQLLERLQQNPYDPDLQRACDLGPGERYAYTTVRGYVVFWQVVHKSASLSLSNFDSLTIRLTGIRRP